MSRGIHPDHTFTTGRSVLSMAASRGEPAKATEPETAGTRWRHELEEPRVSIWGWLPAGPGGKATARALVRKARAVNQRMLDLLRATPSHAPEPVNSGSCAAHRTNEQYEQGMAALARRYICMIKPPRRTK